MNLAFISHPDCQRHRMGAHHPEAPDRLHAIQDRLIASGMEMLVTHYDAPAATFEQLTRAHDPGYVRGIEEAAPRGEDSLVWIDGDTAMCKWTLEAARQRGCRAAYVFVQPNRKQLEEITGLIDSRRLRPILAESFRLREARRAHELSQAGHVRGKIVLIPHEG